MPRKAILMPKQEVEESTSPEQELHAALDRLGEARELVLVANQRWQAAQGVRVGERLFCPLFKNDPGYLALRDNALEAERQAFPLTFPYCNFSKHGC